MKHPKNFYSDDEKFFVDFIDYRELNKKKTLSGAYKVAQRSIYYKQARKNIKDIINDFHPDLVHIFNIHAHITPSIFFEIKKSHIPIVWSLMDFKLICPNTHFFNDRTGKICQLCSVQKFYYPLITRCKKGSLGASFMITAEAYIHKYLKITDKVDLFFCQSVFQLNEFKKNHYPEQKLIHLPLFIETEKINFSSFEGDYFLFFGRIEEFKGILPLLDTFKNLPDLRLKIAGSIAENLKEKFYTSLSVNVEYLGYIPDDELTKLIDHSLAVVVPSTNFEIQPFGILESFARAKSVITSDLGGMKELIMKSEGGLCFDPFNVEEMKKVLLHFYNNPMLRKSCERKAFDYVVSNHSADIHYNQLISYYQSLI